MPEVVSKEYIYEFGEDRPEIRDWTWGRHRSD
jgi:hypothetical protein